MGGRAHMGRQTGPKADPQTGQHTEPHVGPELASDAALRQFSGYTMKRAFHMLQTDLAATLQPFGLRMTTFSALVVICDNPGLRQSDLAQTLMIERPNLVVILDDLERLELISRDRSPHDRRAYQLRSTIAGHQVCAKARAAVAEHDQRVTAGLTSDQVDALIVALRQVELNGFVRKGESDG